jgi:hypothetical protein
MANLKALQIRSTGDTNPIRQQQHITNTIQSVLTRQAQQTGIERSRQYELNRTNELATSLLGFQPHIGYRH